MLTKFFAKAHKRGLWPSIRLASILLAMLVPLEAVGQEADAKAMHFYAEGKVNVGFTLDLTREPPRFKYDTSWEILLLRARPAARGGVVYRMETRSIILREDVRGNLTLYNRVYPDGAPTSSDGEREPLELTVVDQSLLEKRVRSIQLELIDSLKSSIDMRYNKRKAAADEMFRASAKDAFELLRIALLQMLQDPLSRDAITTQINNLRVERGIRPGIRLNEGTLTITVAPELGVEGRPSSARIVDYLEDNL